MTWTYSGNPGSSDLNQLRFRIQDTNTLDQQLTDEELSWLLTSEGTVNSAAAAALRILLAKYSRLANKRVGDLSIDYTPIIRNYQSLLDAIVADAAVQDAMPFAGGISVSGKQALEQDTDRVTPAFGREQFSQPGTRVDSGGNQDSLDRDQ